MKKQPAKKSKMVLYALTALLSVLIIWTIWGNTALTVNTIIISNSRIQTSFFGFKIVQVSDLHNAEFLENNARLLKLLFKNEQDIIVIAGDLIDAQHTNIDIALNFVKKAIQLAPIYYVTGNHKASLSQYSILKTGLEMAGVIVLEDDTVQVKSGSEEISPIGLSDPDFTIKMIYSEKFLLLITTKLKDLIDDKSGYTILLSHRPELFQSYADCNVDLIFSGHAHGGQFRLPLIGGLIAPNQGLFPKYDAGLYSDQNTNMIVSRGIGNSIIPFRFNNRPEIVLVELKSEQNK